MSKAKKPSSLGEAGSDLWDAVTMTYELRADELRVLGDACREADLIDRLQRQADKDTLLKRGSQGQPVVNPLISELRQHRSTFASLVKQLKLPEEGATAETEAATRSEKARNAANARWATKRGA